MHDDVDENLKETEKKGRKECFVNVHRQV